MFCRDLGEHLAIEEDVLFLECSDKFAIGEVLCAEGGVQSYIPEATEIVLLIPAVRERILSGMSERFFCLTLFFRAAEAEALHLAKDIAAAF